MSRPRVPETDARGGVIMLSAGTVRASGGSVFVSAESTSRERAYVRGSNMAFFVALLATALLLGPALAHALALPNKINAAGEDYFAMQRAYDGWANVAWLISVEFTGLLAVTIIHWREPRVLTPVLVAFAAVIAAQAIFWLFTLPANRATDDWTTQPADWERLRDQWEYSHLGAAVLQVLAMAALIVAVLCRRT